MITIPKQLHNDEMKIILLNKKEKIPIELEWQVKNNYLFDDERVIKHLEADGNYGVVCDGKLIVIDADTNEFNEIVKRKFPDTFTVKTSKGFHYYFYAHGFDKKKVLKKDGLHLGEIQSNGTFVVGANCIHPSGDKYEIYKDLPITEMDYEKINKLLGEYYSGERINKDIIIKGSSSGLRNDSMFKLACSFREKELSVDECFVALQGINIKNNPPLSDGELNNIVTSAYKYEKKISLPSLNINNYMDNARRFWEQNPYFYDDKMKVFWMWDAENFKYEMITDKKMMVLFDDILGFMGQTVPSTIKNNHLEAFCRVGIKKKPKESPVKWVQFKDKAFSVTSNKTHDVKPNYFFTNPIPWEIGKTSYTPMLDKLFKEWVGEKHLNDLYEFIAYCCYRAYPIQLLFCLYGHGRNGKSTFISIVDKFLGTSNTCTTDLDMIAGKNKNRFETLRLYKKLACFMGETNFNILENSSILKKLVGGDKIAYEIKGAGLFDDVNYSKIIIASNSLPSSEDTSEGFYRRWHIIDFPNEFPEGKDIALNVPEAEFSALAKKVTLLLPKLLEKGCFSHQGTIQERKEKYIMASNPLPYFLEHACYHNPLEYIRYSELYISYTKFLASNKRRIVSKKEFSKILIAEGLENRKTSKEGNIDYYVEGIKLKDVFPDLPNFKKIITQKNSYIERCKKVEIKEIKENNNTQHIVVEEEHIQDTDNNVIPEEKIIEKIEDLKENA